MAQQRHRPQCTCAITYYHGIPTCAQVRVYQYFSTICFIIILIENNSLIDDVKAKPWNLAILGLFSIAIDLHLSLAGSLCRWIGSLDFSINLICITFQFWIWLASV